MALTKSQQEQMRQLTEAVSLAQHTVNSCIQHPVPMTGDGTGFRICGHKMDWRFEPGDRRSNNWHRHEGSMATRMDDYDRVYKTESEAYLAIYCLMRDYAASSLSIAWQKYAAALTDQNLQEKAI